VTLRWTDQSPVTVVACDENGYGTDRPVAVQRDTEKVMISIEETTAYTIVTR
jgi:hypothetical protein